MKRILVLLLLFVMVNSLWAQKKITIYEYWFDYDHAARISNAVSPAEEINLNTSFSSGNLAKGLHTFHIRFKDNSGKWSSVLNQFFIKKPAQVTMENKITAYRYWFDLGHAKVMVIPLGKPVDPYQLTGNIPVSGLPNGMHTFNIQFRDSLGMWSSTLSTIFIVNLTAIEDIDNPDNHFRVYPNPAYEKLYVSFEGTIDSKSVLVLRNIAGQTIRLLKVENQMHEIDISDLTSGLYFVELHMAGRAESRKIVKK